MTRRKRTKGSNSPLIRLVGLEAAAVAAAAGMTGPPAMAAPGDLDPLFGDGGRQSSLNPSFADTRWSVEVQEDDSVLLGGGGDYCYWYCYEDLFIGRLLPNGMPDASFAAALPEGTFVDDTALQSDGKLVGVGQANGKLQVFRLRPDGSLDPDFGLGGLVLINDTSNAAYDGHSVIVDPDGRIVVAGSRDYFTLIVARLQANGALDMTFGTGGIFVASEPGGYGGYPARVARAPGGGYRVTAHGPQAPVTVATPSSCTVFGLTDAGVLDAGFGTAGIAAAPAAGGKSVSCSSLVMQSDGRMLLGGRYSAAEDGYLGRLLANGTTDSGFHPDMVAAQLKTVTAVAGGSTGSIFVAGQDRTGSPGALVVRMLADGTIDTLFGRAGTTKVDLKTRRAGVSIVTDMKSVANDALYVVGSTSYYSDASMFVARLLGNAAGGSPGVLSMKQQRVVGTELGAQAVLSVQRTGGSEGAVAVTYSSRDFPASSTSGPNYAPGELATSGADYTVTTGRLTWADGDVGEREIVVPIASDSTTEKPEFFEVVLETPEGGAGLGAYGADVEIAGASYPFGDLTIQAGAPSVHEGNEAPFYVYRNYYGQGAVSVTVRVAAGGSATPGQDFQGAGKSDWQDIVLTFGDRETFKSFNVPIVRDTADEPSETFTLELVSPTGGAMLGDVTNATVTILDSPASSGGGSSSGSGSRSGGGGFGWLGAMLLGLGGALRRRRIRNR